MQTQPHDPSPRRKAPLQTTALQEMLAIHVDPCCRVDTTAAVSSLPSSFWLAKAPTAATAWFCDTATQHRCAGFSTHPRSRRYSTIKTLNPHLRRAHQRLQIRCTMSTCWKWLHAFPDSLIARSTPGVEWNNNYSLK